MSAQAPLVPARLAYAGDGTPWSEAYGDVYHSADGGLGQARHVFLGGNDLPGRWAGSPRFTILETGFGLGLNFLATWDAWRRDPQRPGRLDFISVEKHPFSAADLACLHERWPGFAALSAELLAQWPPLVPGFHRLYLDGGRVCLTLLFGDARQQLRRLAARVDAVYLDGFAPGKNPELWSEAVFRPISRLAHAGTTLATYTVAAPVREGLARAGFAVEKRAGFGRKREMLAAHFAARLPSPARGGGEPTATHSSGPCPSPKEGEEREAIVIGAGLAGCTVSERLAARGWQVTVIERRAGPAREASGNLAGIVRPMLSKDDNIASRLSRACFLFALRHWRTLAAEGLPIRWFPDGVLQLARNPEHEKLMRSVIGTRRFPADFARYLDAEAASALLDWPVGLGGWLFPGGGHANPPSVCQAALQRYPDRISTLYHQEALSLERRGSTWHVLGVDGEALASAPALILASGANSPSPLRGGHPEGHQGRGEGWAGLPIRRVRGQVSHVPAGAIPALPLALTREGYATPALDGLHCVGASYEYEVSAQANVREADVKARSAGRSQFDAGLDLRQDSHAGNLTRLERMLPDAARGIDAAALSGRVGFRAVTPDRLPIVGALADAGKDVDLREARLADVPRQPGLYGLLGYGSRGLVWAALAAELLASQLDGDPLPLETELVDAIDPARFLLRAARRGRLR